MSQSKPLFPLNAWYAVAWDHEVKHALTPRKLCNLDVVLYRTTAGAVVALEDACWHRLVPLSMGKLRRKPSTPRPACAAFLSPKSTATCGCGRATRRRPMWR